MRQLITAAACAAAFIAGPALAQSADATPADGAAAAEAGAAASVSDDELLRFGRAVVRIQEVNADATLADEERQARLAAAVEDAGLEVADFNRLGQVVGADQALQARMIGLLQADQAAAAGGAAAAE